MGAERVQDWGDSLASALEWWRDAGVDMLVEDEARDWLARTPPRAESAAVAAAEAIAAAPVEQIPDTLDAFVAWRLSDAAPEVEWHTPRLGPTGPADAEWVFVTDVPEAEDGETLMSGPTGKLFDRMLAAIGLSRESVYLMPLAVARPLTGRIPQDDEARLIALARHHLALLRPNKLFLLGQSASRVLSETSGGTSAQTLYDVNHFGAQTKAVASYHPRFLLERPSAKSEAWKHLLLLSRGTAE